MPRLHKRRPPIRKTFKLLTKPPLQIGAEETGGRDPPAMSKSSINLPPGFRFHPTDEELIVHYLKNRATTSSTPVSIIAEVDIYKFDPWELPAFDQLPVQRKLRSGIASGTFSAPGTANIRTGAGQTGPQRLDTGRRRGPTSRSSPGAKALG
ncbi:hypothetical protein HPP92_012559 [Vanilla planifolia]|uniref:NAC domain-containing protein n=1 Tax=Vanilla planifolia TaxID=51239 RepID=A0A835QXR1_VANPL|nr:hypothetical protein HPP92_012559 [Vanilla planifolia]